MDLICVIGPFFNLLFYSILKAVERRIPDYHLPTFAKSFEKIIQIYRQKWWDSGAWIHHLYTTLNFVDMRALNQYHCMAFVFQC